MVKAANNTFPQYVITFWQQVLRCSICYKINLKWFGFVCESVFVNFIKISTNSEAAKMSKHIVNPKWDSSDMSTFDQTWYLSFLLHRQNFQISNFTPEHWLKTPQKCQKCPWSVKYMQFLCSIWKILHLPEYFYTGILLTTFIHLLRI